MGRIVAVTNLKGGIGKTTTVVNVGAGLALKGARVLLVDIDAQGNLSPALGITPRRTIYDVLVDDADPFKCIVPARPNLDLIGADDSLLSAQTIIAQRAGWVRTLEQALKPLKRDYDFVLVDVPGSLTVLSANALAGSDDLLVPTTVEHFSIKGLELLFKQVARLRNSTRSIRVIIPTMVDARLKHSSEQLEALRTTYGTLITAPIRTSVRLSEATAQGKTIYEFDRRSRGAIDYARLVDHLSALWQFDPAAAHTAQPVQPTHQRPPNGAAPAQNGTGAAEPLVTGAGTRVQSECPVCGHELRWTTIAGYRVIFCDHCRYKHQELIRR